MQSANNPVDKLIAKDDGYYKTDKANNISANQDNNSLVVVGGVVFTYTGIRQRN